MSRYITDPDDARDLAYEDAHDERYGNRGPDPAQAAALQAEVRVRFIEITTGMVTA